MDYLEWIGGEGVSRRMTKPPDRFGFVFKDFDWLVWIALLLPFSIRLSDTAFARPGLFKGSARLAFLLGKALARGRSVLASGSLSVLVISTEANIVLL